MGYITIKIQRGRGKSNLYTINRQKLLPVLPKIGSPDCRSKPAIAIAAELLREEERRKEALLRKLGLEEGSTIWIAANERASKNRALPECDPLAGEP